MIVIDIFERATAYHFNLMEETEYPSLSEEDKDILNIVIDKLGKMSKYEIVNFMNEGK